MGNMESKDLRWWVVWKVTIWDAVEYNELVINFGGGWYEKLVHLCVEVVGNMKR